MKHVSFKWCAYALVLLAPGSFIVLPALWLVRAFYSSTGRRTIQSAARS